MRIRYCGLWLLAATLILAPVNRARGQEFDELVKRLPRGANSIVLLNVDKILASPIAVREKWQTKHEQAYASGLSVLPPDAKQAVFASNLNFEQMSPEWESVVMRLNGEADLSSLAKSSGGTQETIGKYRVLNLPTNAFAVQFSSDVVGAMTPVDRQSAGRWIRQTDAPSGTSLTQYLTEAFGYANNLGTPIIMAIDLQDVDTPEQVLALLKASDRFKGRPESELVQLATELAGIRGLTLGITLADTVFGKVKVDFSDDIDVTPDLAKAMLLHALSKRGAMIKELENWKPNVSGRQVTLEGDLTASGLRRIFSLFDRPPSFKKPPVPTATTPAVSDDRAKLYAAQNYFNRVTDYVKDLRSNSYDANTMGSVAMWYDSYARKIGQLPVVGVDPELVNYSRQISGLMRQASAAIKNANYQKGVRQANVQPQYVTNTWGVTYGYSYGWDGYGGPVGASGTYTTRDYQAENDEKTAIRSEETANAGMSSAQCMQLIDQDTAAIRQRMSVKYKENF